MNKFTVPQRSGRADGSRECGIPMPSFLTISSNPSAKPALAPTCLTNGAIWTQAILGKIWPNRQPNPDFALNQPRYQGAPFCWRAKFWLWLQPRNTPWAIEQYGFRALIAPVTPIFSSTTASRTACCPSLSPKRWWPSCLMKYWLFQAIHSRWIWSARSSSNPRAKKFRSRSQTFRKYCLLNGLDDIGLTLRQSEKSKAFENQRLTTKPWLAHTMLPGA